MSKLDRRNQNRQRQLEKQKELRQEASIFSGRNGAPRNVAVLPLCSDCNSRDAISALNGSLDIEHEVALGCNRVPVDRFKQTLQYIPLARDLTACLDATRVADFVIVIISAKEEVDDLGELILRCVENQGLSTLFTVVSGLEGYAPKDRLATLSSLKSYMTHFHPDQDKLYSLDNRQECSNLMRSLCSATPKGVRWRDERSWMLVEDISMCTGEESTVLTGVVRGKGLKADRLVQVGDWGTFRIQKIVASPLSATKKKLEDPSAVGNTAIEEVLEIPGEDADELVHLAPEEVSMAEADGDDGMVVATAATGATKKGVLLDDHHYFSEEEEVMERRLPKRLPRGTSAYQSAWYLDDDDISDSASDLEDVDMRDLKTEDVLHRPEDGVEDMVVNAQTELGASEYPQSEAFIEPNEAEDAQQLAAYRSRKHDEAQDDLEFPDEIELHPNVLARERLIKYRGLKSLRTSPWDTEEDRAYEPQDWGRLLHINDYQSSRIKAAREALVGGIAPGTRVSVHLGGQPSSSALATHSAGRPLTMISLLRHEYKQTAVNFLFNLSSDYDKSIKAKEELIVQCGPRRFVANPVFSQDGNTPNDVHKSCRYLHPGQSAIATFIGPITWGPVPTLFFKRSVPDADSGAEGSRPPLKLVGTGTAVPPSTSRVIAKRVVLTGHPYHIHKKIVTIRYMFFNREDVEWFKALPLWTKRGRSGYIKESLGTHGYFKANFDGRINPQDTVGVSLYKRVWPRNAQLLQGDLVGSQISAEADSMDIAAEEAIN